MADDGGTVEYLDACDMREGDRFWLLGNLLTAATVEAATFDGVGVVVFIDQDGFEYRLAPFVQVRRA